MESRLASLGTDGGAISAIFFAASSRSVLEAVSLGLTRSVASSGGGVLTAVEPLFVRQMDSP